jgi:uncharacterized protein YhaN
MLELGLLAALIGSLGVYIMKSSDLPQDQKNRSAQFQTEYEMLKGQKKSLKISMTKIAPSSSKKSQANKVAATAKISNSAEKIEVAKIDLAKAKIERNQLIMQQLSTKVDQLTLEITALEQQIKANNQKNAEIQTLINNRLAELDLTQRQLMQINQLA